MIKLNWSHPCVELDEYLSQCPCVEHSVTNERIKVKQTWQIQHVLIICVQSRENPVSNLSLDLYFCRQIELIVSPEFEDNSPSYH